MINTVRTFIPQVDAMVTYELKLAESVVKCPSVQTENNIYKTMLKDRHVTHVHITEQRRIINH